MISLTIRGKVSLDSGEFAVGGVTVVLQAPRRMTADMRQSHRAAQMQLGRAVTDSDGFFEFETDENDEAIARYACVLRHCGEFRFSVACLDANDVLLHETEPLSYSDEMTVLIALRDPEFVLTTEDWK